MSFHNNYINNRIELVNKFVKKNIRRDLYTYVRISDWKIKGLANRLLTDKLTPEDMRYLNQTLTNAHRQDYRTPDQMALNLILGWVVEDVIRDKLNALGIKTENAGTDKERSFGPIVANVPDLSTETTKGTRFLEVVMGYTGREKENGVALRDNKYENLIMFHSYLVGIDLLNEQMFVITDLEKRKAGEKQYNSGFGKITRTVELTNKDFYDYVKGFERLQKILK
jgi:hypothetical protein